jgi:3-hydroxy-9,10-secoandrosta-1,3,5(10)-triene-9,17-dione monooxygenase
MAEIGREEFLGRVRGLVPGIAERAATTEALRRLPDETFKEFQELGLLRALRPRRWGGLELDPLTFYQGVIEVATVCPSSAWVLGVLGVHDWQLALLDERAQADVWREDSSACISSSYAPTGKVERVTGGFRLSGRWSFSSGCDHCRWVFLGGVAITDGAPDFVSFLVPRDDYAIDDVWHVCGLSGTGSKDIVVEGAFVPDHRTHRLLDAFQLNSPGQATNDGPLYRLPFGCVFAWGIAAPAIGAARGALEVVRERTRGRATAVDKAPAADDPFIQVRIAEAESEVDEAYSRLVADWTEMTGLATARRELPIELRARTRYDAARAVGLGVRAIDRLFEASGGRAIFLNSPLQRAFRDVHAMRAHAMNNPEKGARVFAGARLRGNPADLFL